MSTFVRWISWLAIVVTVVTTGFWIAIIAQGNECWSAFAFEMWTGAISCGLLVVGVVPAGILYFWKRLPRDRTSWRLAAISLALLVTELISLEIVPQRGEH